MTILLRQLQPFDMPGILEEGERRSKDETNKFPDGFHHDALVGLLSESICV